MDKEEAADQNRLQLTGYHDEPLHSAVGGRGGFHESHESRWNQMEYFFKINSLGQ